MEEEIKNLKIKLKEEEDKKIEAENKIKILEKEWLEINNNHVYFKKEADILFW